VNTELEHQVLVSIARYGRVNIGNFPEGSQSTVARLIAGGRIDCSLDSKSRDALWCRLTPGGAPRLFSLNFQALSNAT